LRLAVFRHHHSPQLARNAVTACNAISAMRGFLFGRYSVFTPLKAAAPGEFGRARPSVAQSFERSQEFHELGLRHIALQCKQEGLSRNIPVNFMILLNIIVTS
jgi:hypothetical protein